MLKLIPVAVICLSLVGCGGASDDEVKDINKALGNLSNQSARAVLMEARDQVEAMTAVAIEQRELALMRYMNGEFSTFSGSCPAMGIEMEGSTCQTTTCSSTSFAGSCTFANHSVTCGTDTYNFKDGNMNFNMSSSGTVFTVSMNMSGNVSGGKLDGKVECAFAMSMDFNNPPANGEDAISCDNFSCKYKDKDISCEDMQANFASCG